MGATAAYARGADGFCVRGDRRVRHRRRRCRFDYSRGVRGSARAVEAASLQPSPRQSAVLYGERVDVSVSAVIRRPREIKPILRIWLPDEIEKTKIDLKLTSERPASTMSYF